MISKEDLISFSVELVQNNIDKFFKSIGDFSVDAYKKIKLSSGIAFKRYLETSIKKYSEFKTILYRDAPVFIYEFYEDSELTFGENIIDASDINKLFDLSNNKIIISGSAGTGKSTLMKHLFLNSIEKRTEIPIFVELKNINNITDISPNFLSGKFNLLDFIYESLTNLNFNLEKEYFLKSIESGHLIFFFDGFDEVTPEIREELSLQIVKLGDKYFENSIIISSRPSDDFITWNSFTELRMLPLSKRKALNLIGKINYDTEIKERFIEELDRKLYERHESFSSNPLLLTIMLMTFSQFSDIPEKMYLFYQHAFETLFSKHDSTKGGYKRRMYTTLAMDDFVKILSSFSIQSYSNNNISFEYRTIKKYLDGAKKINSIDFDTHNYYRDLCESVSLIVKDGLVYTFSHRIFQEYFTAIFIINCSDERQIKLLDKLSSRFSTDNVFDMLFEMDRSRLEKNYVIPYLESIKAESEYDTANFYESTFKYLKMVFNTIHFEYRENELYNSFGLKDTQLFRFVRKIYRRYKLIYSIDIEIEYGKDIKLLYKDFYPDSDKNNRIHLDDFASIVTKEKLVESMPSVESYLFLMKLLEELKKEHRKQDESIDNILFELI
ncbi:hypothetical protein KQI74_16590 [Paenibacillus barcinonensis]|uniref:NACHT domain-containing protein n=1 Tax=Paenibacillus TaxID=44249 RepID=UPI001C11D5F2|nr:MULTISPECIES: hypothetical protein [Paenibacillus]MBU5353904.1 hypothetical protein [Paenibacillus barcinonensis]MDM5279116.1 hypothetical protein [Paenibacillus silvae]